MKNKPLFLLAILLLSMLYANNLQAVPACPYPADYTLPDGTTITITLKGDEFASWAETQDGYTVLRNPQGFFEYAVKDGTGDLILSGIQAKNASQRSNNDNLFLQDIGKHLKYSAEQAKIFNQLSRSREEMMRQNAQKLQGQPQRVATGTVRAPLILVQFPGKTFTRTAAEFQMLCNNLNYTATADGAITGSVRDYFKASSYNQLDFQVDVYGPFTMSQSISAYDDNSGGDPRNMVVEAANAASAAGCNFSQYDINNDGYVDGVHIIFAGYGQENSGVPVGQSIWSHRWSVYNQYVTIDGKRVYDYSCSPELRGSSGNNITYIGVIAHELSHVFGLPDLYDADYSGSGGQSIDMGEWDIMASGSWNNNGKTPALHSAWCKKQLGWVSEKTLSAPRVVHLPNPSPSSITNPSNDTIVCRINTQTTGEYFLTENRQKQGWDAFIPASGMLIYHVDENYINYNNHRVNADPSHRGLYVKQAGCGINSDCSTRTTDPFPQTGKTQFTDVSTPNSKSWAGQNTLKPITSITHNTSTKTITFNFMATSPNDRTISTSVNPANSGSIQGDGIYQIGNSCTITATANYGYEFVNWTEGTEIVSSSASYTFTVTANRTLVANFSVLPTHTTCATCPDFDTIIAPTTAWNTVSMEITPYACMIYKFAAVAGEKYTFKTGCGDGATANFDTQLYLYNSSCSQVGYDDDGCENLSSKIEQWECSASGDYYLKEKGYSNGYGGYTLAYKRAGLVAMSNEAHLSSLSVNQGTLTPAFNPNTFNYNVSVENSVSNITISATAVHTNATVAGTGNKTLNTGNNSFAITVTAEDGTTQLIYNVSVTRAMSNEAHLSSLSVNQGTLTPAFNPNTSNYNVSVENSVSNITISATPTHPNATIAGTGNKTLNTGSNSFNVTVTAEDGTTQLIYNIVVTRAMSNEAHLSSLSVNQGTLTPVFDTNTFNYNVSVENSIGNITISATADHPNATIAGTGNKNLNIGDNSFVVVVTAEDGTTQLTYNVVVKRATVGLDEAELNAIKLYPNPVNDELRIMNYELKEGESVQILDFTGKIIYNLPLINNAIDVSNLAKGIYFVKISAGDRTIFVEKFIKK